MELTKVIYCISAQKTAIGLSFFDKRIGDFKHLEITLKARAEEAEKNLKI
eukprot:CAMPEP_0117759866 /NCGR_PEP_ID=MMETSP0947-20121206/16260_1 /TAXON_ID=44440 /ORGANISM="Chattonella subsalsa, Strain CCMP2191" /LENGTH=49 /DNA_ID=CAMNT_0005580389 /DNA_START=144 /DNA_END=293 /DNA_ORIENTATION=-